MTPNRLPGRERAALAVIAAAQFMVIMDTSIIGVALPQMQRDLGFAPADLSWVFNAYVVAFGGLLLLGGRLSDLLGARRVFAAGWAVLTAGSLLAGFATTPAVEITARAVQGAGSALIAPSALSLLFAVFGGQPARLGRALALYGAAAPAGGTAGVFLGGLLTEHATWPWVFFVNVPVAVAVLAVTGRVLPAVPPTGGRVDLLGGATVTAGLAALVLGLVRGPEAGWASAGGAGALGVGVALLALFVVLQANRREPLVRLGILRTPQLAAANVAQLLLGAAWIPMFFIVNLYLQEVLKLGPFASGAALLPLTVTIMIGMVVVAPRATAALGPKAMTVAGLAVLAAGLAWLAQLDADGSFATDVLPASLVVAAGMAMAFIPSLGTAIGAASPEEGGLASGLVNTSYQVGSAVGLAAATAVMASLGGATGPAALTEAYSRGLLLAAGVAVLGAVVTAVALRGSSAPAGTSEDYALAQ